MESLADVIQILRTLHVAVAWQAGAEGGGLVLSPVEVLGGFATAGSIIGYLFKRYADARDSEIARLANQNERLIGALFQSTANTDRGLGIVERTAGGHGHA